MKVTIMRSAEAEAKTLRIRTKVCDQFECEITGSDGATLKEHEGYVPSFMPGEHYGDYLFLDIDIETGQITNWNTPTRDQLEAFINKE